LKSMSNKKEMSDKAYYGSLIAMAVIFFISIAFILNQAHNERKEYKIIEYKCSQKKCETTKPEMLNDKCVCIIEAK